MTDTSRTPHVHRSRNHSRRKSSDRSTRTNYLEPVYYFSGAILFLLVAKLLHSGLLSPAVGALGLIILTISKIWKFKPGIVFSGVCIFAMTILNIWKWADTWFLNILSPEMTSTRLIFLSGLAEGAILTFIVWIYYRLIRAIHMRMTQKWFIKKSYVIILKMLYFFHLFLILLWLFAFMVKKIQLFTRLNPQDAVMLAGALALLCAGIPAIIYLSKSSPEEKKRRRHRHHRERRRYAE
ncbi:MAG: hypothetical protein Q8M08_16335 [Bacteroidales bacterium]|nr:hypothetical protein [Bacteroidales bacterium]